MIERFRFRSKVVLLTAPALVGLLAVPVTALVLSDRANRGLSHVENSYLPLLEVDRDLKALYASITHTLEGAVTAGEPAGLRDADLLRDRFIERLEAGREAIAANDGDPRALLTNFLTYFRSARAVSADLMSGAAGEEVVARMETMRGLQQQFAAELDTATAARRDRMTAAFRSAREGGRRALAINLAAVLAAMVLTGLLSWRVIRGTVHSLGAVQAGVERLAQGDLNHEIQVNSQDELGDLARQANQTAARLRDYRENTKREDWIKTGLAGLTAEIAGEHDPQSLARRAVSYLARYFDAPVAVIYGAAEDGTGTLTLLDGHAHGADAPASFAPGEGLIGQAARDGEVRVVSHLPDHYLTIRSALGEAIPRHLLVAPFGPADQCVGVLELASMQPWGEAALEVLRRSRTALGVAFTAAQARERVRALLDRTQALAEELQAQQEELREANEALGTRNQALLSSEQRLQAQQEELQQNNEELEQQAQELEAQRQATADKNRDLEKAQRQLQEKIAELGQASRYKSEFLANMSHELRTPLNSIMILSQMLADNETANLSPRQIEFSRVIHKSGGELLALINEVLDLAKVESGKHDLVLEQVSVESLARYARQMFEPMAAHKGLALEVVVAPGTPAALRTDRARLEQIVKNLVSNALKFTDRGRIGVRLFAPGKGGEDTPLVSVAVSDTGVGIPAEKQRWIFESFAQIDGGTSRKHGGTGLGLAIARQLAMRLGGDIAVESRPGEGSTFTLTLPVAGPVVPAVDKAPPHAAPEPAAARPARNGHGQDHGPAQAQGHHHADTHPGVEDDRQLLQPGERSLLVIEDDAHYAAMVLAVVREAGFRGLVAATGSAGIELAARHRPLGIIMDIGLPDLDGWAVMERLKANPATRAMPVHVISAIDGAVRAARMGAVGFLNKPAGAEQINLAILRLVATAGLEVNEVLLVVPDPALRESLGALLGRGHARVDAVAGADEALARLAEHSYQVVVVDLAEGDKEAGFALVSRLRADEHNREVPIIVHTEATLTPAEVLDLEAKGGRTIVVLKTERSTERLLDETRLFLHHVRAGATVRTTGGTPVFRGPDAAGPSLSGRRVMVVDDDMRNVFSLSSLLAGQGMDVVVACDGQEAIDKLDQPPPPDVVLMDVMMSPMDGYEATRRIRQDRRFRHLPVIALTAKTMPGDRQKCLDAGANDYIPKPVDVTRLLALLRLWVSAER
jgi:signal transduction histidine kinase/DNA-binding response OmpR family regulator